MPAIKKLIFFCILVISANAYTQTPIRFLHAYGSFSYNYGMSVHQETDSGYVILANVSGLSGNNNILLFKINKNGGYVWDRLYQDSSLFWAQSMRKTPDKGFLITGYTNKIASNGYDVVALKTDSLGIKQWAHYYGGADWDFGMDAAIAKDGNYLVCGSTYSYGQGNTDMYLLKLNTQGDTLWTRTFGGEYEDVATSIDVCQNGDILIAGYTNSFGAGNYDALLVRYDSNGNYKWNQTYGDTGVEKLYGVRENYNKDIVLGGHTSSFGAGGDDFYIIYADSAGQQQWYKAWGGPDDERAYSLDLTADSGYVLCGLTEGPGYEDIYFFKMHPDGDYNYSTSHGSLYTDYANCIKQTKDGGYIIVGTTMGFGGCLANVFVIKTGVDGLSVPYNTGIDVFQDKTGMLKIYPNPFTISTKVEIPQQFRKGGVFYVYDTFGRMVFEKEILPDENSFYLYRNNLSSGVYFYRWVNDTQVLESGKVVIE